MLSYHLTRISGSDGWGLKKEGDKLPTLVFGGNVPKKIALRKSVKFIERLGKPVSLKIHKADGRIQEERTYPRSADPKTRG